MSSNRSIRHGRKSTVAVVLLCLLYALGFSVVGGAWYAVAQLSESGIWYVLPMILCVAKLLAAGSFLLMGFGVVVLQTISAVRAPKYAR